MQPEPILLDDLGLARPGRVILSGLTARLEERRIGLLGRNGSGKTSLARLIAGLDRPTTGRLSIGEIDPARDRRGALRRIGILFQNPDHQILFPTVIEELCFGLQQMGTPQREAEARARALLAEEGRAHWADAECHRLSQGQRQYLCLMAVLLMGPQTLILDEPFAGLDLPTAARLRLKLEALDQRLILISHDPALLARMDRLLWIEDGRLAADGAPDAVLPAFLAAMEERGTRDAGADLAP